MGLKCSDQTYSLQQFCIPGSNQTKMGLKLIIHPRNKTQKNQFKSDQNGIEICSVHKIWYGTDKRFKSDQNGIEIHWDGYPEGVISEFKSDQNGIEMPFPKSWLHSTSNVQIRPKWDWNYTVWAYTMSLQGELFPFKSDQNGIEIRARSRGRPRL